MNEMKRYMAKRGVGGLLLAAGCMCLTGCATEDDFGSLENSDEIIFQASIEGQGGVETRANNNIFDVTPEYYDTRYYISERGLDTSDKPKTAYGVYHLQSGSSGTLSSVDKDKALNWFSRDREHEFSIWTAPFDPNHTPTDVSVRQGIPIEFKNSAITDLKDNSTKPNWEADSWKNGECLEQFIGGQTTREYQYNIDGMYVPVTMRHLVSKIMIKEFNVIDNFAGVSYTKLRGVITLYGLPDKATFYPVALDGEGNELPPYVEMPKDWTYDNSKGVDYVVANYPHYYYWEGITSNYTSYYFCDSWYICPDVDLSKLSFKVQLYEYVYNADTKEYEWIPHRTRGQHGAFFGDFKNVKFTRSKTGDNYDDIENPGSDVTILHAGEYVVLKMNLLEKGSPVIRGEIYQDWWKGNSKAPAYVHQGMYTYLDVNDMNTVMNGSDEQAKKDYFDIKGSGRDTGSDPEGEYPDYEDIFGKELNIFELFDDIGSEGYSTSSNSTYKPSSLYASDGYILDGRGHTVNIGSSTPYIGNVRDVYLHYYYRTGTDPYYTYTEYMIYIDKMGNIYTVNLDTYEETPSGVNINDLPNPSRIDMKTGKKY